MKLFYIFLGLFSGVLFGLATPLCKLFVSTMNSFLMAGLLYIGAGIAFLPEIFKIFAGKINLRKTVQNKNSKDNIHLSFLIKKPKLNHQIKYLAGIISFGGVLGPLFLMIGLKSANSMSVSIWLNLELVATAILGVLIFKDHIDKFSALGAILTILAGILISLQESQAGLKSGIFILLACICWGFDNHLTAIVDAVSVQTVTFLKGTFGGITNLIIGLILSEGQVSSTKSFPIILIVGIFSYGISIFAYVTSAQNLGPTRAQILFSTSPFWGVLAAFILLDEKINLIVIISFIMTLAGILFSNITSHSHMHHHDAITHLHLHRHDDEHHNHIHPENIEVNKNKLPIYHSHMHTHRQIDHDHKHYPDIHHRHKHLQKS
jgi:drug/metabolite transporter (DMT)-like permease